MKHKRIYLVVAVLLLVATLVGLSAFRRSANVTAQNLNTTAHKHMRKHDRGLPADFKSDVAGIDLMVIGVLPDQTDPGGADETALLRIVNLTGRGIDAYTVGGGDGKDYRIEGQETGWDAQGNFTLDPPEPLIPPHGQADLQFPLRDLKDGWPLHLMAVKWHGGNYEGSAYGVRDLEGTLQHHLEVAKQKHQEGTQN
jgi:hypothetical protein